MKFSHCNKVFVKQKSLNQSDNNVIQVDSIEQDLIDLGFQVEEIIFVPKILSSKVLMQTVVVKDSKNKSVHVNLNADTLKKIKMYLHNNPQNQDQKNYQPLHLNNNKIICRICLEESDKKNLIRPCQCKGSIQYIHEDCLKTWLLKNHNIDEISMNRVICELCKNNFKSSVKFQQSYKFSQLLKISTNQKLCLIGFFLLSIILFGTGILLANLIEKESHFFVASLIGTILCFFIGVIIQMLLIAMILEISSINLVQNWKLFSYSEKKTIKKSQSAPVLTIQQDFVIKALTKQQTHIARF